MSNEPTPEPTPATKTNVFAALLIITNAALSLQAAAFQRGAEAMRKVYGDAIFGEQERQRDLAERLIGSNDASVKASFARDLIKLLESVEVGEEK